MTARWVVVNADDLGVSRGATLGVVEAHQRGVVTSASLAVTTPAFEHALDSIKACPQLGIGLHFTLTSGRPASDPRDVPLLVDRDGYFRWRFTSLLRAMRAADHRALAAQIRHELVEQLGQLTAHGIRPDHVDGERHIHLVPGVFGIVAEVAEEHGIPFVRAGREAGYRYLRVAHVAGVAARGGFVKSALLSSLARSARGRLGSRRTADHLASFLHTGRGDLLLHRVLATPPVAAVTEVMVHPGVPGESRHVDVRNRELERYLTSPDRRLELDACLAARGTNDAILTTFGRLAGAAP